MVPLPAARASLLPFALLVLISTMWGSFYGLIKIGTTGGIAPSAYLFWFGLGAGTILFAIAMVRGVRPPLSRAYLRYCVLVGLIRFALANIVFYTAQKNLPLGIMALVMTMTPVFTQCISLLTRLETFRLRRAGGILLAFAGVALIVAPRASLPDPALIPWVLFGLIGPLLHATGYVMLSERARPPGTDSLSIGYGSLFAAALWILPWSLAMGEFHMLWPPFSDAELALTAHLVLAGFNFYAIFELIRIAGPTYMSQANFLAVGVGVALGIVFFGESHSLYVWAAMALVLGGVALVSAGQGKAPPAPPPRG